AKDRTKKAEIKKGKAESGERREKKGRASKTARTDYEMSLGGKSSVTKKEKKEKKAKKADAPKSKYNGNYDIFKKK
ncbi:MAG: hypothetical protein K2L11_11395, partial [Muribaculaceae bacterium]|nr:hypothetical protein [Muribaculaceae bacterium]